MRVTAKQHELEQLQKEGLSFNYVTANIQPFIGFMSAFTTVKPDTTLRDVFDFAVSREEEAIEYVEKWYVKVK